MLHSELFFARFVGLLGDAPLAFEARFLRFLAVGVLLGPVARRLFADFAAQPGRGAFVEGSLLIGGETGRADMLTARGLRRGWLVRRAQRFGRHGRIDAPLTKVGLRGRIGFSPSRHHFLVRVALVLIVLTRVRLAAQIDIRPRPRRRGDSGVTCWQ